jgi:hypothetical protein
MNRWIFLLFFKILNILKSLVMRKIFHKRGNLNKRNKLGSILELLVSTTELPPDGTKAISIRENGIHATKSMKNQDRK